ncbi:hypothetical protein [Falsigemmobacter faecalis]|uniref:Uncharacterized protein n=1 Tax=Falsigemmobacter faecalis TaxID=2488730 RepID=A0A3P3D6S8_9RHOB|nr:hypothetical protein [Falsigemmobacter faecalis]RRH70029.1 hypothetical protein EG244_17620 [Falsigemmobacter faecalis]
MQQLDKINPNDSLHLILNGVKLPMPPWRMLDNLSDLRAETAPRQPPIRARRESAGSRALARVRAAILAEMEAAA